VSACVERARELIEQNVDLDGVLAIARQAPPLATVTVEQPIRSRNRVMVGIIRDRAFSFYYPENLEAMDAAGGRSLVRQLIRGQPPAGHGRPVHRRRLS